MRTDTGERLRAKLAPRQRAVAGRPRKTLKFSGEKGQRGRVSVVPCGAVSISRNGTARNGTERRAISRNGQV